MATVFVDSFDWVDSTTSYYYPEGAGAMALKVDYTTHLTNPVGKVQPKPTSYSFHSGKKVFKPITGMVTTEKKSAGKPQPMDIAQSQVVHPGVMTNGMQITVEGGRTLNLGNYESARIGVSITVPCDKDMLNEAYDYATDWVSKKIEEAVKIAKGEGG